MDSCASLPRLLIGRALGAALALVVLILAGCASPGSQLRAFGIVGTFAEDCSRSIDAGGARAIYDVPATGYPTFTAVNRYGTFRSTIVRADRVAPDTLVMYSDDPGGAWNEIDIQRKGDGFVTTRMVSHKPNEYRPLVAVGDAGPAAAGGDDPGLFMQKCAE
jgi:hypothetical protein